MIWILEKFRKFIKGITFEPAFFLFMLAHGFYVIVAQTLYIGKFTYQEILILWKSYRYSEVIWKETIKKNLELQKKKKIKFLEKVMFFLYVSNFYDVCETYLDRWTVS